MIMNSRNPRREVYKISQRNKKSQKISKCVQLVIKPLRIIQFLAVLLMFSFVVYATMLFETDLPSLIYILLLVLSGAYLIALSIDLISQFGGGELGGIPMFLFTLLGTILFAITGILLLLFKLTPWYILTIACLSLFMFILFVIQLALILIFWKRSCNICHQCYTKKPYLKEMCSPLCETVKHDLMTSVSQIKLYDDGEEVDHSFRKIAQGYRRQYIDCSTSAQKLCHVDTADIQTDHYPIATAENQTLQEMKEINVQTLSKCELCHQQIQFSSSSSALVKNQFQCATCPAFIQLFKGMSCSKCATGMMQMPRQNRQQQTQQAKLDKEMMKGRNSQFMKRKISGEMLTSGQQQDSKVGGCSSMITKLTVASYCVPPEKTHISSQTASKTKNNEERSKKLIMLNRNNNKRIKIKGTRTSPSSKNSQQSSRSQIIENGNKVIEIGSGNSISIVVTPGNDSRSMETIHRIVNIGCKNNSHPSSQPNQMEIVEQLHEMEDGNKRGTLQFTAETTPNKRAPIEKQIQITSQCQGTCDTMHLELATINSETGTAKNPRNQEKNPAMRQSRTVRKEKLEKLQQTELINRRENEAQTVDDFETLPRGKRTYAKALRKNKVKPADASVSDISITLVPASNPPSTPSIRKNKKLGLQNSVSLHEKYINVCPICKRLQIPMKGPPFQYYSVNKDKRGRFYCDTCAPPASIKISFKRTDQQRLKCCQCGNYLRIKNSQTTRNKSDHCPHCDLSLSRHHISST